MKLRLDPDAIIAYIEDREFPVPGFVHADLDAQPDTWIRIFDRVLQKVLHNLHKPHPVTVDGGKVALDLDDGIDLIEVSPYLVDGFMDNIAERNILRWIHESPN